jgi:hypothetical protein
MPQRQKEWGVGKLWLMPTLTRYCEKLTGFVVAKNGLLGYIIILQITRCDSLPQSLVAFLSCWYNSV